MLQSQLIGALRVLGTVPGPPGRRWLLYEAEKVGGAYLLSDAIRPLSELADKLHGH